MGDSPAHCAISAGKETLKVGAESLGQRIHPFTPTTMFDLLALLLFVLKLALFLLSFAISVAGIFLVTIPFTGALVRLRGGFPAG